MASLEFHSLDFASQSQEFLHPDAVAQSHPPPSADAAAAIAPWLDEPEDDTPSSPPKSSNRSFGFTHKASLGSVLARHGSVSTFQERHWEKVRASESHLSLESTSSSNTQNEQSRPQRELQKSKSSMNIFSSMIKRSRSKPRAYRDDEKTASSTASLINGSAPPLPAPSAELQSFLPMACDTTLKREGKRAQKKSKDVPTPRLQLPPSEPEITLDTNLDEMEGIVDPNALTSQEVNNSSPTTGSGLSGYHSSGFSTSDGSFHRSSLDTSSIFSNPQPFAPSASSSKTKLSQLRPAPDRKVSPKTPIEHNQQPNGGERPESPSWTAPESWAVEKEGGNDLLGEPEYSSSEGETEGMGLSSPSSSLNPKEKRKSKRKSSAVKPWCKTYKLRVYRVNSSYHVVSIALSVTVAELTPVLNQKLLLDPERETHRLYLKERGRERVLAQTEKPADIVRRRLEQAGYDYSDNLDMMGAEDITFLLKFVYKSNLLGPSEEELTFDSFEYIDLTGRSLKTVPIILYSHADSIVSLNLSRNPMLEIPRDFIQACTTLRELRLSNMAMKHVPQSVRYCGPLHRLDISSNRIVSLDNAYLDQIPDLRYIKAQNNRLEEIPWYFPRMKFLRFLNISNNKFRRVPPDLCKIESLVDLDISFNMISELPDTIGNLKNLERLVIVGNQVSKLPETCRDLESLKVLDCRRNHITDLVSVSMLPKLEIISADHNAIHALELSLGPSIQTLDASSNDITQLTMVPGPLGASPYALVSLDISNAKLSSLDEGLLRQLTSLTTLKLDHNKFRVIPETLGELEQLVHLSCSDNQLEALPVSIGKLQELEVLDVHNNSITYLPDSIWNCGHLTHINMTSNLLGSWQDPPPPAPTLDSFIADRKPSAVSTMSGVSGTSSRAPPLVHSLVRLSLGENRLTDDALHPLSMLKELRVLNLSFNEIQEMPSNFFRNLHKLEELYLSGNKLSTIPTEDLHRLTNLTALFLNGNKLQTLPHELGKVQSLAILDVGSNSLKYNINNWEFDWNWNFNQNLKYLNLSGNKRLEIKPEKSSRSSLEQESRRVLSDFSALSQLRVLGLMDVTNPFGQNTPDDNETRRVRTSASEVNGLSYGIADTLGKSDSLTMFDLVKPEFRGRKTEAVFAMFGRSQPTGTYNRLSKYLHNNFLSSFSEQLGKVERTGEGVPTALRRSFLDLNKKMHEFLYSGISAGRKMSQASGATANPVIHDTSGLRSGASGVVVYLQGKMMYVANAGNALAVVSRQGQAIPVSRKHDPFDRMEIARIRAAEGWVTPKGYVNDEIDVSRSFGFYHLLPVVNARPDIHAHELTPMDEFVIIANRGLWDFVSYRTAVDIARSERGDPMIAAQKLRDFAISYGADGSTMIMVVSVAELFRDNVRSRQPTIESLIDHDFPSAVRRKRRDAIADRDISRLDDEVDAPVGHLALVFTDICNSTHLWEVNAGMATAMRLHNSLLRRQLRLCGGYEVKTEGDCFMCSFPTTLSALWFCLSVQLHLLDEPWPLEILECEDGKEVYDANGNVIEKGLSVRMGIHCGMPACERDLLTHRMDYFGSMVNRSARIMGEAAGGQIMCSADVVREINARIFETEQETDYSWAQPPEAVHAIRSMDLVVVPAGEVKLKGLEVPEMLSAVYPRRLAGRKDLKESDGKHSESTSRVQFSPQQMRELALLATRLEALTTSRVFRPLSERNGFPTPTSIYQDCDDRPVIIRGDPNVLLPAISEKSSDYELMVLLDSLSSRITNALTALSLKYMIQRQSVTSQSGSRFDERTLQQVLSLLQDS